MKLRKKKINKIISLFEFGKTIQEIKKFCNVSLENIYNVLTNNKLASIPESKSLSWEEHRIFRREILEDIKKENLTRITKGREIPEKRNLEILTLYKDGKTLEELGKQFNFSRSRAQQIVIKELKRDILKRLGLEELAKDELILLDVAVKEEIKEISTGRKSSEEKEIKERIQKKIDSTPHARFVTVSNYARALGERSNLIKKYFPEVIKEIVQRQKQLWSRYYNKCRICGTTSIKHASHGLCENCYPKSDIFKDMQEASRLRNKDRWKKHLNEYAKEYAKRPEVIVKTRLRWDRKAYGGNREKALARDNYKCQGCGISRDESNEKFKKDLFVDHIGDIKDNRLENLLTVCKKCHNKRVMALMHKITKGSKRKK